MPAERAWSVIFGSQHAWRDPLYLARALIAGGIADRVLAIGLEKMERGSLKMPFPDRVNPMDRRIGAMYELHSGRDPVSAREQVGLLVERCEKAR
jgi:acetyl-CoA acetyltransferase